MTVPQAINVIIKEHGKNILNSPERLQAMVKDYVKGYEQEKKLFCHLCQKGILVYARKMVSLTDEISIRDVANKAKIRLEQDDFMAEKYALLSINMILEGLGLNCKLEEQSVYNHKNQSSGNRKFDSIEKKAQYEYKAILTYNKKIKIEKKIIQDLEKAAQDGDEDAMISLGDCYAYGITIVDLNWRLAEYYYQQAEELGSKEATYKLIKLHNLHRKHY